MLGLLTGIPGFGKTAHAIDWVFFQDSDYSGLDKYVEGISGLDFVKCPHFPFPKLREVKASDYSPLSVVDSNDDDADKYKPWLPSHPDYAQFKVEVVEAKHPIELWYLWAAPSSVIVIDEAQQFYRPRPSGSKIPLHIKMLEYHRHFGVHFLLISQAPRLMDLHFRSLVEKHVHLDKTWKGGLKYEWVGCRNIDGGIVSATDKKDAAKSGYKPPKHVFPLYKSSSVHLKTTHKMPKLVWLLIFSVPLFIALVSFLIWKVKKDHSIDKPSSVPSLSLQSVASGVPPVLSVAAASAVSVAAEQEFVKQFSPVVHGRPETAPAFNDLRKVVAMPLVSACIQSSSNCRCYTQQGSRIPDLSPDNCRSYIEQGRHFQPYVKQDDKPASTPASASKGSGDTSLASNGSGASSTPLTAQDITNLIGQPVPSR